MECKCCKRLGVISFGVLAILVVAFVGIKIGAAQGQVTNQTAWPMFGGTPSRNMVNTVDKNIPADFSVEVGKFKNVKWVAELGNKAYGGPVVSGGKVFVGTNNAVPRDPRVKGNNKAVLMAFNELDGKFLWQVTHDIPTDNPIFQHVVSYGLLSTPAVDKDRICYVTPSCEVICADTADGKIIWRLDVMKEYKVRPYHCAASSPLIVGDLVMIVTGNGIDEQEGGVASPKSPSFLAINKFTGKPVWQSNLPGENIIEGQWSNAVLAIVNGKEQVVFAGGDAWLYAFEPKTGELIWKCNCNPQQARDGKNYFIGTPVVHDNKLFVGLGICPDSTLPSKYSFVLCLDITKKGDVSLKSMDQKDPANKDSALVWAFGGPILPRPARGRAANFGSTIGTCAVVGGLVYISEERGYLHCLDEKTGQRQWEHDFKSATWGSPYFVDGKIYHGSEGGEMTIFAAGRQKQVLAQIDMDDTLQGTPVAANGVLYIATKSRLYAIAEKKQ